MRVRERRLHTVATHMTVRQRVAALLATRTDRAAPHDDIGRGLTPAGWAELHRYAERVDRLNATTRDGLARAASAIDMLLGIASRRSTITLLAILAEDLQDALVGWQPRRGRAGAADRDLDRAVRQGVRVLRRIMEDGDGIAHPDPPASTMDTLLRDGVLRAHHLLRALEIEAAAFAADLAADPLAADLHAQADRCRARLRPLPDLPWLDPPIALTEPSDDDVAAIAARCRPEEGAEEASW